MKPIIQVEKLGKRYRIGTSGPRYGTLRDSLAAPFKRFRRNGNLTSDVGPPTSGDTIWALKDVSFEVMPGEVVGIIGRNGAGKSTLLKILSRITEPTTGAVDIYGRVGSLLEVGTGFHPELTGRENILLNGSILGMKRTEIQSKFDEIVAFAEIEKFIDTPVKHYSSGMYVRLAFAVAAHLEPEILLVDEVLAVGDAAFQKKCLGKIGEVAGEGRTVLFVSHNMAAVRVLCTRGILLKEGTIAMIGQIGSVVDEYLRGPLAKNDSQEWLEPDIAPGNEHVTLSYVRVRPPDGEATLTIDTGALLEIGFLNAREGITLDCTVYLVNSDGVIVFESGCMVSSNNDSQVGQYQVVGRIPPHLLNAGRYYINLLFGKDQRYVLFRMDEVVSFQLENTSTGRGLNMSVAPGVLRPQLQWTFEFAPSDVRAGK